MIVVKDLLVDKLDQFPKGVKSIEVAGFCFEMTVKRFLIAILPRRTFGTH